MPIFAVQVTARQSVGEQLRKAREAKGWTVRDVARLTGITFTHIARIERGKYNVNLDTVAVIAAALELDIKLE